MFIVPFKITEQEYSLFVGLAQENLERMKEYDPAEVVTSNLGEPWASMKLKDIIIGSTTEADLNTVHTMGVEGKTTRDVLKYLTRGFAFRPDAGDRDGQYVSALRERERSKE